MNSSRESTPKVRKLIFAHLFLALVLAVSLLALQPPPTTRAATQTDLPGPAGSGQFGYSVTVLANGNIVVTDPYYNAGAGAVYLYDGATLALLSTLAGSTANDRIGSDGVTALNNGNYVVRSPGWANGAGAVTWCSGSGGCTGTVSAANSLVGSTAGDQIGYYGVYGVMVFSNGNYMVSSPDWHNGAAGYAGAVTWCSGSSGCTGAVSAANSLVGSTADDSLGLSVMVLSNGSYVVRSPYWDNGTATDAGAVTWCSGSGGCTGAVSAANSLVGSTAYDQVGYNDVTTLSNGNYVVRSLSWHNGATTNAGAVTWCSGSSGCTGAVSAANSLVGSTAYDWIGYYVTALSNGSYVVTSPWWDNGAITGAGAVTWCSESSGCTGTVSTANSLVGSTADDQVGYYDTTALSNGNYVVTSPWWDNDAAADAGAVTWCSGSSGCTGAVSAANSLVGSTVYDQVGYGVTALSNGNYMVRSPLWDNGAVADAGAATWCSGSSGCTGVVSATNSLVGSTTGDLIGYGYYGAYGVTVLSNGNYVVNSPAWHGVGAATWCSGSSGCTGAVSAANSLVGSAAGDRTGSGGATALSNGAYVVRSPGWANGAGAVTWCSGSSGCTGAVSTANSLVSSTAYDQVGYGVTALSNGSYVVRSPWWANGAADNAGAVTWCSGSSGCTGTVSATNSLVGSTTDDRVGHYDVTALSNGSYVVRSPDWDNGAATDAGAATWCSESSGCTGAVSAANSLVGSAAGDLVGFGYDGAHGVTALSNGNYVVTSPLWNNGAVADVGAATWCSGSSGCKGAVSAANSLVGSTAYDQVGYGATALSNGSYVVRSPWWDNGAANAAGAISLGQSNSATTGPVGANNSVLGAATNGGYYMTFAYDAISARLVVGRPYDNIVSIFFYDAPPSGTGPGGVGTLDGSSSLALWLKGDAGVYSDAGCTTAATNGGAAACWTDQSGNALLYTQATAGSQPAWATDVVNSVPVVRFTGNSKYLGTTSDPALSGWTLYTVLNGTDTDGVARILGAASGSVGPRYEQANNTGKLGYTGSSDWASIIAAPFGSWSIISWRMTGSQVVLHSGGASDAHADAPALPYRYVGYPNVLGDYTGDMAEIVIYGVNLNTAQRTLVENYLSAKYGGLTTYEADRYVGDTPSNGDYDANVAGIGQEADGDNTEAHSVGLVLKESGGSLDNDDYVLAGHKTTANGWVLTDLPAGMAQRWSRVWYVDKTGAVDVNLAFDFSEGGIGGAPGDAYRLLYSATNAFSFADTGLAARIAGDQVRFTVPDGSLADGYYTLGETDTCTAQADGAWSSPATWDCGAAPRAGKNVVIGSGRTVTLDADTAAIKNLTLDGTLQNNSSAHALALTGNWTNHGTFDANGGMVTFNGAGAQNLAANTTLAFANLTVNNGVTLVETTTADNVTVTGSLTNNGTIRKTQAIGGTGLVTFGLTGVQMNVSAQGTLTNLQVDRVDSNHPNATIGVRTSRYWTLTSSGGASGYTVALAFPHNNLADPTACRYVGPHWDCDRTSFTPTTVTRSGVTTFSAWAVGDGILPAVAPTVSASKSSNDVILNWTDVAANAEGYVIWYSETPYFLPDDPGATSIIRPVGNTDWTHTAGAGDPAHNYYYIVQGVNAAGVRSGAGNGTGVFSFTLTPGN